MQEEFPPLGPYCFWAIPRARSSTGPTSVGFPGHWHHGDFVEMGPGGGVRILGRSDATLNPGGVRMGTAEIYGPLEELPFVADCLCVERESELLSFLKDAGGVQVG